MSQHPLPARPTAAFVGASWAALAIALTAFGLGLSWTMVVVSLVLMATGLSNAALTLSEKGFYGLAYTMAMFSVVAVQKNVRDLAAAGPAAPQLPAEPDAQSTVWQ